VIVTLNDEQSAPIYDYEGARSIVAGPGSGKTATMVALVHKLLDDGVSPSDIRAVTFSKEMAAALERRVGLKGVASTFHSLGYLICSETERKPVEPELRHRLMCKLVRRYGREYKEIDHFIAQMRRENISPDDAVNGQNDLDYGMACAYAEYERVRADEGWMDFDSMLADAVLMLENPIIRRRWQPKYMIVDEAQDTDDCQ
jgi:superfamily I DNA/RNA helicase